MISSLQAFDQVESGEHAAIGVDVGAAVGGHYQSGGGVDAGGIGKPDLPEERLLAGGEVEPEDPERAVGAAPEEDGAPVGAPAQELVARNETGRETGEPGLHGKDPQPAVRVESRDLASIRRDRLADVSIRDAGARRRQRTYLASRKVLHVEAEVLARLPAGDQDPPAVGEPGAGARKLERSLGAKPLIQILYRPFFLSPEKGGSFIVQLAADPALAGVTGKYFETGKMVAPAPLAQDEALARKLWDVSATMTGLAPASAA